MMMIVLLALFSFVVAAIAQSSSSSGASGSTSVATPTSGSASMPTPSGLTPCVMNCVNPAVAAANCTSFTDVQCVCSSNMFRKLAEHCLKANCTADEKKEANHFNSVQCRAYHNSTNGSASAAHMGSGGGPSGTGGSSAVRSSIVGSNSIRGLIVGVAGAAAALAL